MVIVSICVGSSCHLKGSEEIVALFQKTLEERGLQDDVVLMGSLCMGKCNRTGVTIQVDEDIFPGVTVAGFSEFFEKNIMSRLNVEA